MVTLLSILYTNYENIEFFYKIIKKSKKYEKCIKCIEKIDNYRNICKNNLEKFDKYFIYLYKKSRIDKFVEKYIKTDDIDDYLIDDTSNMIKIVNDILKMENIPNQKDMNTMIKDIEKMKKMVKKNQHKGS